MLNQLDRLVGVVLNEVQPITAEYSTGGCMLPNPDRPIPYPLCRQPDLSAGADLTFQHFRPVTGGARDNKFRALRENGRRGKRLWQRVPKKNVAVEVYEGFSLGPVGPNLTERPPTLVVPGQCIQLGRHLPELQS